MPGALAETTVSLAGSRQAARLSALVNSVADPVDAGIAADRLVERVNSNDFVVLVDAVLVDPVGLLRTSTTSIPFELISRVARTFKIRRPPQRRATRSSAVDLNERWNLSWLMPWLTGLP